MSGFTEGAFLKKLQDLNSTQQSIQTLSLWLIHHRKHHATAVRIWMREFSKLKSSKQLTYMYLANDVIQNSKKKGPEYGKEFGDILKSAFELMATTGMEEKTKGSLGRILDIWKERNVYEAQQIEDFRIAGKFATAPEKPPHKLKRRRSEAVDNNNGKYEKKSRNGERERSVSETKIEVDGHIETHITLSPKTPPGDPPEPDELIKALLELENSASSDAVVRERIASLPPEVSEVQLLSKLQDKESAHKLSALVSAAVDLLADYNARLTSELENRKKLTSALRDFTQAQKDLTQQAEQRLEEYNEKLQKIYAVKEEIRTHMDNLPDVTQLPDVTSGLAPLPSAGDLFTLRR